MFDRNDKNYVKSRRMLRPQRPDKQDNRKSGNLKQMHKILVQDSQAYLNNAQRASAAQILLNERAGDRLEKKKNNRESAVNFYINIDKLKNLKISGKDNRHDQPTLKPPSYHENNRKSLMLRNYGGRNRKGPFHSSYDNNNKSISRIYQNQAHSLYQKPKSRYRTQADEGRSASSINKSIILKKSNFKKTTQVQVKDKTFMDGYLKGKQLGRGGFSKVWQGFNFQNKTFYAIKEIDTQNKYQTHLTQIWFGNYFFENGMPKKQFLNHRGIHNLLTMYSYSIVDPRAFIVYETCDGSLGNMLYDIYEEEGKQDENEDNRLYMIKYKKLYGQLRKSTNFLKCFIYEIAQALDLLAQNRIVHSDIKTQNILLRHEDKGFKFKLIDYGSSFHFKSLKQYKLATPEYMCPELLNYILEQNKKEHYTYMLDYVKEYTNISGIDVWGLGCIVLELIHGLPLWLTNPTRIMVQGKFETKKGLFAVSDRSFSKILERQLYIVENLDHFIAKNNNSGIALDQKITQVLKGMLNPNPSLRMTPSQIIQHLSKN